MIDANVSMITGDIKQEVKTKSVAAIFLSILIIAATITLAVLYIQKADNCYLYLETGFLKILMHGKECK